MKTIVKKGLVALIASMFAVSVFAATQTGTTTTSTKTLAHNTKKCAGKSGKALKKCMKHHGKKHKAKAAAAEGTTTSTKS